MTDYGYRYCAWGSRSNGSRNRRIWRHRQALINFLSGCTYCPNRRGRPFPLSQNPAKKVPTTRPGLLLLAKSIKPLVSLFFHKPMVRGGAAIVHG